MKRKTKISIAVTIILLIAAYALSVGYFYKHQREILFQPQERTQQEIQEFAKANDYGVFQYQTPEGIFLTSLFKAPVGDKPVIILFNGNAAKIERAHSTLEPFVEKGYGAFINIYRGYGANGGEPSQDAFYGDAGLLYSLVQQIFPENEIIVYGYSIGTSPATFIAAENHVKALILEGAFTSAADLAKDKYPFLPVKSMMKDQFPTLEYFKQVAAPIIMIHGVDDKVVDIKFAKKLASENRDVTFKEYEGGNHINLKSLDAYNHVLQWLEGLTI
jgi:fermentation-respiration switch protein FrsA (DUF1100 family)